MLEIKNLNITYQKTPAVNDVTFSIQKGEVVSIVGESGSGKTTLLKAILGLLPKETAQVSGSISYKDKELLNLSLKDLNTVRGQEIAVVFQDVGLSLNPIRKIGPQFIQYIRVHQDMSKHEAYELAVQMLKKVNLEQADQIMNSYVFNLSGGMKQRVGLAMAMALYPSLLLLDEATSALDSTTQKQVIDEILSLKDELQSSVLMITHDIALALHMSDKVMVMKKGRLVEINSPQRILKNPEHEYTKQLLEHTPNFEVVVTNGEETIRD